jgi:hypothetical protein
MALPKEPRQKMINLMYLVLTALLALNVSSEILNAFKVVDTSLKTSSANLTNGNNTIYASLEEKLSDPKTHEKAAIWEPKAQQAKKLSDEFNSYIDGLKAELKKEADLKIVDGKESFREDDLEAATRLFGSEGNGKGKGKELEGKLATYRNALLNIDPSIKEKFDKTLPIDVDPPVGQDGTKKDFTQAYFHMTPAVAGLTLLSKFQNNIKNAENQVVTFCHEQIGAVKVKFDKASVLVGQSSNYVMPGQEITITAGVGAYSSAAQPKISINGSGSPVVDGKATYKVTASGAGNHTVPVNVTYLDQDGVSQTKTEQVEYTVGTPGGAAVMLDKMNVFYIGVPNPITISSGSGWDKTTVSMTGGTLSGSNGNRTVTVNSIGAAKIIVTADGKSTPFDFRCKRIPDPIFKVGASSGGSIPSAVFKAQQYCRADLENFDFDARFSVVSATVFFSGAGFSTPQMAEIKGNNLGGVAQLSMCRPGTSVIFDQVKVQGPDGTVRTITAPGFMLK